MQDLKRTALFDKHKDLKAKNIGFCGWEMPVQYEGIIKEHAACRNEAAIFDTSHMGEFFFEGNMLFSGINDTVTIDLLALPIGKCKYGFLLNKDGGVIDDLIAYKADQDRIMFVVNASRIETDYKAMDEQLHNGILTDASEQTSKIDIQGPKSKEILQELVSFDLDELDYFSFAETAIMDTFALVSRTGYTGELGYELYLDNATAPKVWEKLVSRGAVPAGLGARDVLRLEMGYSLYGQELDENTTPLEAGLGIFTKADKHYTGKDALEKQKAEGIPKKLIAFKTNSKRAPRIGFDICQNGEKIGTVTSGTFSPSVESGIGLGYVDTKLYKEGEPVELKNERGSMAVEVTKLPFYKKGKIMKRYSNDHEWAIIDGDTATIGLSAYAVDQLGDITFLELPEIGQSADKDESIAFIESVKAASDIYIPIGGEVVEVNEDLNDAPEALNEDAEGTWVLKIKVADADEFDTLMDEEAYKAYIETL